MLENTTVESVVEDEVKYYVFVKNGRRHYDPQYISAGMVSVIFIFPLPEPNTIGTLDEHSNGIVSIKFGGYGEEPSCNVIAQDFSDLVLKPPFKYRFCPNFSEELIAYSTAQSAIVVNVKNGKVFNAKCDLLSENDYMLGIRFLNQPDNLFVIVKSIDVGGDGYENHLHIVKLEGQQFIDTGWNVNIGKTDSIAPNFPLYHTWFVHDCKLFVYHNGRILCTDDKLPVSHPFSEIVNSNSDRIGNIKDLAIHPTLPFGVMIEDHVSGGISHQLTAVCWAAKKPKEQIATFSDIFEPLAPLFGLKRMALTYQSFSPDGSWYVVGCLTPEAETTPEKPKDPFFIAIPVDDERPDFLDVDKLVVLGQVKNMTSLAWTNYPTAYVVSDGQLLHKWDLDKLPTAREFVMPEDGEKKKGKSIFRKIGGLFG